MNGPLRLKTRCRHRGCPKTTRNGWCEEHAPERYHRDSDRCRGTPAERGYDEAWRRLRASYYREHPLCEDCLDEGVYSPEGIEVDHVIPIHVRPDRRLDGTNLRSRCVTHHRRKTQQDIAQYGRPQRCETGATCQTGVHGATGVDGAPGGTSKSGIDTGYHPRNATRASAKLHRGGVPDDS
jgi:5-methylcytosine-specific restriction enzyme A